MHQRKDLAYYVHTHGCLHSRLWLQRFLRNLADRARLLQDSRVGICAVVVLVSSAATAWPLLAQAKGRMLKACASHSIESPEAITGGSEHKGAVETCNCGICAYTWIVAKPFDVIGLDPKSDLDLLKEM